MTDRELLAIMASILYEGASDRGMLTKTEHAIMDAECILAAVDRRLEDSGVQPQGDQHGR